jgi:two-component system cell cycle response regulator DivK
MNQTGVLTVDDNEMISAMAQLVLTAAAQEVRSALDAEQALSLVPDFLPEMILMDSQMPVMGRVELTRQLKADPATRNMVIVACTAFALHGDASKLRAAGFDGYIAKPVEAKSLAAEVRFWLEGSESNRGRRSAWP